MSEEEAIVAEYLLREKQHNYQSTDMMGTPEAWLASTIREVIQAAKYESYQRGFTSGHDNAARNITEPNREAGGSDVR